MRYAVLVLLLVTSCEQGSSKAPLDYEGRKLLDPVRFEALRPAELIQRLELRSDARVADIGAGPGFLTLLLARAVPGADRRDGCSRRLSAGRDRACGE
jgi:hypothetical protein